jgi:hypothetical protein
MKAKLLKKVRKRFTIVHHPNGFVIKSRAYNYNLFFLEDAKNSGWWDKQFFEVSAQCRRNPYEEKQYCPPVQIFDTEKECINYLKNRIIKRLKDEGHKSIKDKRLRKTTIFKV